MQIPLIHDVDVLVYGATSGAVTAALAAKEAGQTVLAVSDRSYFGEETAGALRLWPKGPSEDPLFRKAFPSDAPPTPLHVKRTLEGELLGAGIPFLFTGRPVFALRDAQGHLAGFVLAARSSLYAVRCRVAVDASPAGLLARLTGVPLARGVAPGERHLVVVGAVPPTDAGFTWQEAPSPVTLLEGDAGSQAQAYTITVKATEAGGEFGDQAARDFLDYTRIYYPGLQYTADTWIDHGGPKLADNGGLYDAPSALPEAALHSTDGRLFFMNRLLPLNPRGEADLWEFAAQLRLGRRVGRLAARAACDLPTRTGPYIATVGEVTGADMKETVHFIPGFTRPIHGTAAVEVRLGSIPMVHSCDVAVAGGGTAGAPAGIAAARAGGRTVVLERLHALGGVGTLGLISRYWYGNRVGFTSEVDHGVDAFSTAPKAVRSGGWNPYEKAGWFARTLHASGGTAWFNSFAFGVTMDGGRVSGLLASTPFGVGVVQTGAVVDASGNADVAAAAGAPCREVEAEHVAVQGTGLPPLRPGLHYRNTDHTFIDENDLVGITHAFVNARVKFQGEFDVAPTIGTRERRQIRGEIELSPLDFLARRTFPDTVVTASSNFDSHGFTVHPVFMVVPPDKQPLRAHVPFRCMLPQGVERLLVTGLGMSAHRDALPVVRMQPDVQNQGYAAGFAAARAARTNTDLRTLDIRALQQELVAQGILEPDVLDHEDSFPLPDDVVREAVAAGPSSLYSVAVMFAHAEVSVPQLIEQMESDDPQRREDAARILGLMGRSEAAQALAAIVAERAWDEGWNYRGMGQFGYSMSPMDTLIVALGRTGSAIGVEPVLQKIESLDEHSEFSHCRAVSIAASSLGDPRLARALYGLLQKPGMQGHAQLDTAEVSARANSDPVETEARNQSLKELILGRGLYLCGDHDGLGRRILETYTNDLRGHYARHAQAVLASPDVETLRKSVL